MRVYIAGPMSGLPDYNRAAFQAAEARLRELGHEPVTPWNQELANQVEAGEATWLDCIIRSLKLLESCDGILLLHGSEWSRGARIENQVARKLGLKIMYESKL